MTAVHLESGRLPPTVDYVLPERVPHSRASWEFDASRAVLLIHDMQRYFLRIYGENSPLVSQMIARIAAVRDACDGAGIPVFYTTQVPHSDPRDRGLQADLWGPGMRPDPDDTSVTDGLEPGPEHEVLRKWRYSAFQRSPLHPMMVTRGRDQIVVVGVYAQIGCLLTAADAFMRDIQPFMVADAVADFSAERHAAAVDYVAQHCGVVTHSNDLLERIR